MLAEARATPAGVQQPGTTLAVNVLNEQVLSVAPQVPAVLQI